MTGNVIDIPEDLKVADALARVIGNRWSEWDLGRAEWKQLVYEVENFVYATDTRSTSNSSNPWAHSTHIPKLAQIYDNLTNNYLHGLFPHSDWLSFEADDEDSAALETKATVVDYLKTKHRLSKLYLTVKDLISDWVRTGNCIVQVDYVNDLNGYTGPKIKRINPFDIVFNPMADSFDSSPKIIRTVYTVGDLIQKATDEAWPEEQMATLDKIRSIRSHARQGAGDLIDEYHNLTTGGFGTFSQYLTSGFVELLEFSGSLYDEVNDEYIHNRKITVIDRSWVLSDIEINSWDNTSHIYHSGWRERPGNLWAMGPLDNLVGMQYLINHLENARADAFDEMLSGDLVVIGDVETEVNEDGSRTYYVASERGDVKYLAPDTTILNADFKIGQLEDKMELYAGAPREAMGIRSPGEKTKFEVQSLTNAASRAFQGKLNEFERTIIEPVVNAELELAKKNLDADMIKQVDTETGAELFNPVTKESLQVSGVVVPIGARHYARQAQLAQELSNLHSVALTDEQVRMHFPSTELARRWGELLGEEELVEPYARISEQQEAQRLQSAAQDQVLTEQAVPPEEPLP